MTTVPSSIDTRQAPPAPSGTSPCALIRRVAAAFWLRMLFFTAQYLPIFAIVTKAFFIWFPLRFSKVIRHGTRANGRRILGPDATPQRLRQYAWDVVSGFYEFICDVGRCQHMDRDDLLDRIETVEGHERYLAARSAHRGAILLTAHMGSFEVATAALLDREKKVHIVFKRDPGRFEQIRQSARRRLGVIEEPIDDGLGVWIRLRDALLNDEAVAIQGDRVLPGQKGRRVPFLNGHLLLPTGPIKLAIASGAPIIPVFALRTKQGRIRLHVEDPILVGNNLDELNDALLKIAAVLERYIRTYPDQWLVLRPAFCEDAPGATAIMDAPKDEEIQEAA